MSLSSPCQGFFNFTMDSIMKIFFGEDSSTVMGKQNRYGEAFDNAQGAMRQHMVKSISFNLIASTFLPWPFSSPSGGGRAWGSILFVEFFLRLLLSVVPFKHALPRLTL